MLGKLITDHPVITKLGNRKWNSEITDTCAVYTFAHQAQLFTDKLRLY